MTAAHKIEEETTRKKNVVNTLPQRPENVLQHLCKLSQLLLDVAERESQALVQNDMLALAIIQDEKEALSRNYMSASEEFRRRLHEFRNVDRALIDRLDDLQARLGERTNDNNRLLERVRDRAEANTHKNLLLAQEYGQRPTSRFPKLNADEAGEAAKEQRGQ